LKIVHVSTFDTQGGAARAAYRLQQGLCQIGQDCQMLVRYKYSVDENVVSIVDPRILEQSAEALFVEGAIQQHYINAHRTDISNSSFTLPYPGFDLSELPQIQKADIINLHWVAYLQSPPALRKLLSLHKPIVWTLHDERPFTGGCHYSAGCEGYRLNCAACPQLADDYYALPSTILQDNLTYLQDSHITIVTPSRWLAERTAESRLFGRQRIEVIPYSIDADVYHPIAKVEAKHRLGMGPEVITLLFGAQDGREKRKGFRVLLDALQRCLDDKRIQQLVADGRLKVLSLGYADPDLAATGLPIHALGYTDSDEEICLAYSAADVFVLPSLEDNLPNTMLEAMSCGTPVIGSRVGGIPELVIDGSTGFLVPPGDARQLTEALLAAIFDPTRLSGMGHRCRQVIEQGYTLHTQATRYLTLYTDLCKTAKHEPPVSLRRTERSDEQKAKLEPELGVHFNTIYDSLLSTALHDFAFTTYRQWQTSEADRAARLQVIKEQGQRLGEIDAERNNLRFQLDDLRRQFEASEADRAARLQVIEEQGRRLSEIEAERHNLQQQLAESEEIRGNQASLIEAQEHQLQVSMAQLRKLQQLVQTIRRGHVYSAVRRLGGWEWFDQALQNQGGSDEHRV
jgi:glycosyltransferase involved in cell wall biosynthesis